MHNPVHIAPHPIQFADDTIIVAEAHPKTLKVITEILSTYEKLTGLKVNKAKSAFVPISIPANLIQVIQNILGCPRSELPMRYLGLPLSVRKPRKEDFQVLITEIQGRLAGWKSNFMSFTGRMTLVKSVLTAMPLHFMQAIRIPKCIIKHIDKLRRSFLWKGNETCKGINCLVNWEKVCLMKRNGGMGVIDLQTQNEALMIKWLWKLHSERQGMWASSLRRLHGIANVSQVGSDNTQSYFLKSLAPLLPFYATSVVDQSGTNVWKWTASGSFTTASTYQVLHNPGIISAFHAKLWKLKVPTKVRTFVWLLLQDSILTQHVLLTRGCVVTAGCGLCGNTDIETSTHLLWTCQFAKRFWMGLLMHFNLPIPNANQTSLQDIWWKHRFKVNSQQRPIWDTTWASGMWALWRERNRRFFSDKSKTVEILINDTTMEIQLWNQVC